MIGLDTNVLVRYFLQDDDEQAARADRTIGALSEQERGFVSTVVLVELYWVLHRRYRLAARDILRTLQGMVDARELVVQQQDVVRRALRQAADGADFADTLIAESGRAARCTTTVTLDGRAAALPGMSMLT